MNKSATELNNLHTKEECPNCHFIFIAGYQSGKSRQCPTCQFIFISGQNAKHNANCQICINKQKGTNNAYYRDGCPAIMSDGRFITYRNSTNELTENMRKMNGFTSPNEFRQFMQNNADHFIDAERNYLINQNTCNSNIACSQGWYDLWNNNNGSWSNNCTPVAHNV